MTLEIRKDALPKPSQTASRTRQIETPVPGVPGLRMAVYPSGRRTFVFRYRNPATGRKTAITLGEVTP